MPAPSTTYEPRHPAQGPLYQIVHDHFETFRAQAASLRDGEGLPSFVEQAFRDFLRCGWLAGGFARLRCGDCGLDRLIPFSCKGRALCPSCGGRRMAERAAHLVDHVFPDVPVRQCRGPRRGSRAGVEWVLSLPYRLRYLLAWDHDLCRAVVGVLLGAVGRVLRARARDEGVEQGRGGGVAVIQRFGGALNLNVHIHALVLDGVFARDGTGALRFHATRDLTTLDVAEVLATVEPLVARRLRRRGLGEGETDASDALADQAPVLAWLAPASVQGTVALVPSSWRPPSSSAREPDPAETARRQARGQCWASLMARTFGFDVLACPLSDAVRRVASRYTKIAPPDCVTRKMVSTPLPPDSRPVP